MTDTTIRQRLADLDACPPGIHDLTDQGIDLDAPAPGPDQWATWVRAWMWPGHPMRQHAGWCVGRLVAPEAVGVVAGADLSWVDLRHAVLAGADLRGAVLRHVDLTRAALVGADLTEADLTGARLTRAGLHRADLSGAELIDADFRGASLTRANLTRAELIDADFRGASRHPGDLPVPGWNVVEGRLRRA